MNVKQPLKIMFMQKQLCESTYGEINNNWQKLYKNMIPTMDKYVP